ncbi:hypothetical protein MKQ68_08340 [Chitinophaga horti]|uniref:DUF1735 domain-containing protein n=1 Tax=Chitinophaga horti TaxID=2920382 RepID=A0ABY6J5Z4_9BACT|nr:hypothetical protein [Chitinophaga horti]UYQ95103.1 hypothetical protein MKQ68_08340 [Chitinophaga horti]
MNHQQRLIKSLPLFFVTAGLVIMAGCKKEVINWTETKPDPVTDTVTTQADNRIISFAVATADEQGIYANVNNSKKEVTIYLPSDYAFNFIEPDITLPQGATISPAATELLPVFSTTPITYTVTGKSKETAQYKVNIVVQQPQLILAELSTSNVPKVYSFAAAVFMLIKGENIIPNGAITSMQVLDAEGKTVLSGAYEATAEKSTEITFSLSPAAAKTAGITAGTNYWVQVSSYALKTKMKYPIRFSNIPQ